jgi:hypothetical protein
MEWSVTGLEVLATTVGIVDRISMIDHQENVPGSDQVRDKIRKPSP